MPRTQKMIRKYTREVADLMGLDEWRLYIRFLDIEDNAQVVIDYPESKQAQITFSKRSLEASRDDLRRTVTHELMHCVLASYANQAEGIIEIMIPGEVGRLTRESLVNREEEVTHWFSRVMAHHLPLIGKA
jgi:hypothetical protein